MASNDRPAKRQKMDKSIPEGIRKVTQMPATAIGLYSEGKHSDLVIICGDREGELGGSTGKKYNVHKFHFSMHSKVFDTMLDPKFKEGQTNHIDLPDDDPEHFDALVEFMYRSSYKLPENFKDHEPSYHANIFVLADKYDVPDLRLYCEKVYEQCLDVSDGVTGTMLREVYASVPAVYGLLKPSSRMRHALKDYMSCFSEDIDALEKGEDGVELMDMREEVMSRHGQFAMDAYNGLLKKAEYLCARCLAADNKLKWEDGLCADCGQRTLCTRLRC